MSAALPMFTDADVRRLKADTPFFQAQCQALLSGIRVSRRGYIVADNVDYDTIGDVVTYLLEQGVLGFFHHQDDGECIGIRNQLGGCGPYTSGYCPLPGQEHHFED
jgi:hypothetical protein